MIQVFHRILYIFRKFFKLFKIYKLITKNVSKKNNGENSFNLFAMIEMSINIRRLFIIFPDIHHKLKQLQFVKTQHLNSLKYAGIDFFY